MNMADIDFVFAYELCQIRRLDQGWNAESFEFRRTDTAAGTPTGKHLESRLVEVLAEDLKGLLRAAKFKPVGHVKDTDF